MKISLFIPCLVDQAAPETAVAVTRVLEKLGHEVQYDPRQTCCGQAPFNAGFRGEARKLAIRFLRLFNDSEAIVSPGGSCVSMVVKHYGELDLPPMIESDWRALKGRIWEFCSFLVDKLGVENVGASFPYTVTYHASCHLLRDLGVDQQPLKLLKAVSKLELIEGDWGNECCGFGGAFSVKYPELSGKMADRRAKNLVSGGAQYITGADDSCLLNLGQALKRIKSSSETIHIARILSSESTGTIA